jgi:hypothetical protein
MGMINVRGLEVLLKRTALQPDLKKTGDFLQRAMEVGRALTAFDAMGGQDKPEGRALEPPDFWCVGTHPHFGFNKDAAGRHR